MCLYLDDLYLYACFFLIPLRVCGISCVKSIKSLFEIHAPAPVMLDCIIKRRRFNLTCGILFQSRMCVCMYMCLASES